LEYIFSKQGLSDLIKFYNRFFRDVVGSLHQEEIYYVESLNKWFYLAYSPNSNFLAYSFGNKRDCPDSGYFFDVDESITIPDIQLEIIYNSVIQYRSTLIDRNFSDYNSIKEIGDHDNWLFENYDDFKIYKN